MRVVTNERVLKRRERMGLVYLVGATVCLVGGFFLSSGLPNLGAQYATSIGSLILGLYLWSRNQAFLHRWGRQWRQDGALSQALHALDDRYHLLVAPGSQLPDYVVVGPMGALALVTRPVKGAVLCSGNRWHHDDGRPRILRALLWFAPNPPLGNPSQEAERGLAGLRSAMAGQLSEALAERLATQAVIVFSQPKVSLRIEGCPVPTLLLRSLRNHLSRLPKTLSQREIHEVVAQLSR